MEPPIQKDRLVKWVLPSGAVLALMDWYGLYDDAEGFRVIVQEPLNEDRTRGLRRLRIAFHHPYFYRVADEGMRFRMLEALSREVVSTLVTVEDSSFRDWGNDESGGLMREISELRHYLILTTDNCVDVLSATPPDLLWLD